VVPSGARCSNPRGIPARQPPELSNGRSHDRWSLALLAFAQGLLPWHDSSGRSRRLFFFAFDFGFRFLRRFCGFREVERRRPKKYYRPSGFSCSGGPGALGRRRGGLRRRPIAVVPSRSLTPPHTTLLGLLVPAHRTRRLLNYARMISTVRDSRLRDVIFSGRLFVGGFRCPFISLFMLTRRGHDVPNPSSIQLDRIFHVDGD